MDEKNGKLTFQVNEDSAYLLFGSMLPKVKANNIKYQNIFEGNDLGDLRDVFIPGGEDEIIDDYRKEGIY